MSGRFTAEAQSQDRGRSLDAALLPLINVVLLLLVVFLIAGAIRPQSPLPVRPPLSAAAVGATASSITEVALASDGRLALDGALADREEILAALRAARAAGRARRIRLIADAGAEARAALALAAALREAGASAVSLAARSP